MSCTIRYKWQVLWFQIQAPLRTRQHARWLLISEGVIKAVAVMINMRSFLFFLTIYVLEGINLSVYNMGLICAADLLHQLVAHFASLSCGSATQLAIATLSQARAFLQRPFTNFTTHKSNLTVRVGNLLCLVSIICAKDRFELLSTQNWSFIFNRRRVTNNI